MRTPTTARNESPTRRQDGAVLRIGDVASATGVSADTLRFYERRGLVRPAGRRASGYREYTEETVRLVRFIRQAQSLGFTLAEVEELVRLRERAWAGAAPSRLRAAAAEKLQEIDRRVRELRALRGALDTLLRECDAACASDTREANGLECPLIEALEVASAEGAGDPTRESDSLRAPSSGRAIAKRKKAPVPNPSPTRRRRT
jgi:MerR family transcriptional regulator, copper efflux regulator